MSNDIKIRVVVQTASGQREIKEFNSSVEGIGDTAEKSGKKAGSSFQNLFGSAKKFLGIAGVAGLAITVQRTVSSAYNRMMDRGQEFESSLAELSAITGIAGDDLENLGANALQTSVKYGTAAADIVEANKMVASQLAEKIDFGTDEGMQQLQEVSDQAVLLKNAAGVELNTAVEVLTTAMNQFNMEAEESERLINSIAAGSKFGAAELAEQSAAYRESGTAAASANRSFEELNASTQILAQNAITGSRAGTQLRNIFTRLETRADRLAEHGIGNVNLKSDDWHTTLSNLAPLLDDTSALVDVFGEQAASTARILIQNADSVGQMTEKVTDTNTAAEQAATRLDTYEGASNRLAATIDSVLIPAFQETGGALVEIINYTARTVQNFAQLVRWINRVSDAHSHLRDEISQNQSMQNSFLKEIENIKREMADYALQGDITAEQEKELREAFEQTTDSIKARISSIEGENTELKERREEIEEQLKQMQRNPHPGMAKLIDSLNDELAGLEMKLAANDGLLGELNSTLTESTDDFEEYIEQVRAANEAQEENNRATDDQAEKTAGLSEQIKELKEEYEALINQADLSEQDMARLNVLNGEIKGLEQVLKLRQQMAEVDPTEQTDIPGDEDDAHERFLEHSRRKVQAYDEEAEAKREAEEKKREQELQTQKQIEDSTRRVIASAVLRSQSRGEAANAAVDAAMAELVAIAMKKAMESLPFPANLAAAAGAAITARGLRSLIPEFADGGMIHGPGTGRSDSILMRGSRGEYMLNERSTSAMGVRAANKLNANPRLASQVGEMIDRMPNMRNGGSLDLTGFENAMTTRRRPSGGSRVESEAIVSKLDEVAERIERSRANIDFRMSEFNEKYQSFIKNEELQGRV